MPAESTVASPFASRAEFREVLDATFGLMGEDPAMGPRLRAAGIPQRFVFTDLELAVTIRSGARGEPNVVWTWGDADWEPRVEMTMTSEVANRYFQGRENVAIAIARRRIRAAGDVEAALALVPLTRPVFARYRELVLARYPHLAA